jgi:hypothetical protein
MPQQLPEYLHHLQKAHPQLMQLALPVVLMRTRVNSIQNGDDDHTNLCVNQCRVAWELWNSICCLAGYDYGLGAMGMCRNLFELVAGTIFLIEHPEKTYDFVDYGKKVAYELVKEMGADDKYTKAFASVADYESLIVRFGKHGWHGTNIRGVVEAIGMGELYKTFYKEASSIAHGDSFVTLRYKNATWQLTRGVDEWRTYVETALRFALSLMTLLYFVANTRLNLPYVAQAHELANLMKENDLFG